MKPSSFKLGRILGKCQLLQQIGQGGMGSVYLAKHVFLQRMVTVKLLRWTFDDLLDRNLEAFERGAVALARLNHPNIATIYDIDEEDGRPYVVMEFVEGEDLATILKRTGPLPPVRAAGITRDVARALTHAHAEGVIHRDIKPSNILISSKGQVKVIDFGLAVQIAPSRPGRDSDYVEGTPHYLSPEQARGEAVDGRSDIYSLGITLYEMLCGQRPFQGRTASSVILKHLDVRRPVAPIRRTGSAGPLADILDTMLALDPKDRYPTARETADALRMYLQKRAAMLPRRPLPGTGPGPTSRR
jgi:serine/threonine-protein kinase